MPEALVTEVPEEVKDEFETSLDIDIMNWIQSIEEHISSEEGK